MGYFSIYLCHLRFFSSVFYSFLYIYIVSLGSFISKYFKFFFVTMVNGIASLISFCFLIDGEIYHVHGSEESI